MPLTRNKRGDSHPTVSVLMTVYNAGEFLKPAIDSLRTQTFTNFELIIIENGSTDGSREIVRSYDDPRLKIFEFDKNIGRTPALIAAFEKARGELVAILDADDIAFPQKLEYQVKYLAAQPDVVLLGTQCEFMNQNGDIVGVFETPCEPKEVYQTLAYTNVIAHSSAIYRRDVAIKAGGYPEKYVYAQDFGLWVQLAKFGKIAVLPETLTQIRQHDESATSSPENLLSRSHDSIRIFKEACKLPGIETSHLIRGYKTIAKECVRYSILLAKSAHVVDAVKWGFVALFTYTCVFPRLLNFRKFD
jgi:glycosyltransferase involved in cell wall biosynthesis